MKSKILRALLVTACALATGTLVSLNARDGSRRARGRVANQNAALPEVNARDGSRRAQGAVTNQNADLPEVVVNDDLVAVARAIQAAQDALEDRIKETGEMLNSNKNYLEQIRNYELQLKARLESGRLDSLQQALIRQTLGVLKKQIDTTNTAIKNIEATLQNQTSGYNNVKHVNPSVRAR